MLLGEYLVQHKLLSQDDLERALEEQKKSGEFLGYILLRRKVIKEEDLLKALAVQFHMPFVRLKDQYIDWKVATRFSSSLVVDRHCLPFREDDAGITVAITNPLDAGVVEEAEREAGNLKVRVVLVSTSDMREAVQTFQQRMAEKIKKMLE